MQLPECSSHVKGTPHHVVIGFNLGEDRKKPEVDVCVSPRSGSGGEPPGVKSNSATSEQAKSPRSVLGRLLAGVEVQSPQVGVVNEDARVLRTLPSVPVKSKPFSITEKLERDCVCMNGLLEGGVVMKRGTFQGDIHEDYQEESIFSCAASPFSACCSLDFSGRDFLSVCFFCKSSLKQGKDLYMYKGDKAFCSTECRYQQIVLDEFKERQSLAASCFMRASNQSRKMYEGASAAVA